MYEVVYLPTARRELEEAALYIAVELSAPESAGALVDAVDEAVCSLREMPYRHAVYQSLRALEREVRFIPVKNHNIFYIVHEEHKVVEIQRILYQRRNVKAPMP